MFHLIKIALPAWICATSLLAQAPPVTILNVRAENAVLYFDDTSDLSKWGTLPGPVALSANFSNVYKWRMSLSDIVAVNDQPVKGNAVVLTRALNSVTDMTPGRVLMDLPSGCPFEMHLTIAAADGTVIGSISAVGVNSSAPPAGAPSTARGGYAAVVGGTGAFLGIRGQMGMTGGTSRMASITEDPAYRRVNGGGYFTWFVQLIPASWPEVLTAAGAPAIYHGSDFAPVTAANPARAGEIIVAAVSGLGPVRPNLDPGKPFPAQKDGVLLEVLSPVDVTVNGKAAKVLNKVGWPEMTNVYRVDFRVPDGIATGPATLQLSAAWINGPEVKFVVQ